MKTPLAFVGKGVKINSKVYQEKILRDVVYPWAQKHFKNMPWELQKDWALAYASKSSIALCNELFSIVWNQTIWPSNSPDLNPMGYSVSSMEGKIPASKNTLIVQLKETLQKVWNEITIQELTSITDNFIECLKVCIAAKGGNFENFL